MVLPSSMAPFSEKASAPLSSVRSLLRPALIRSTLGLLQTQPQLLEQTAYVRGVVDDAELFADDLGYPLARPYVSSKTVRWCSLGQKLGQSGTFFLTQAGRRPGSDPTPQALDTFFTPPLHPLAYGSLAHAQSVGYFLLLPPLSLEFPGPKTPSFTPVASLFRKRVVHEPILLEVFSNSRRGQ